MQGLTQTYPGQGLGSAAASMPPSLEPVLTYRIGLPPDVDARAFLPRLRQLEEEDPQLHIVWDEALREIHVQLMGTVQIEVLKSLIRERFDVDVQVDSGRILYQETIAAPVEGVGHFEPLRHYAEVHRLLEPAERGTGLTFDTSCSEDVLDRNWQRLILTHLAEKCHRGVLTGAPLTDVKITLLAGRAHVKHTEGGDFRQATWRAVRQGLMQAESVLLEPYYAFRIEVPAEQIGRAISDVRLMCGTFSSPETHGDMAVLTGRAPVSTMRDYPAEVAAYTRGRGRISCTVAGYDTCHNAQEVIAESGYDPTRDPDNTPDSVFCAHGAGTVIPWDRVRDYMHLDTGFGKGQPAPEDTPRMFRRRFDLDDRELEQILQREFGPIHRAQYAAPVRNAAPGADETERAELFHPRRERVIVDGYNVIFAWDELRALADSGHIDAARERLMDALSNYAAFTRREIVFALRKLLLSVSELSLACGDGLLGLGQLDQTVFVLLELGLAVRDHLLHVSRQVSHVGRDIQTLLGRDRTHDGDEPRLRVREAGEVCDGAVAELDILVNIGHQRLDLGEGGLAFIVSLGVVGNLLLAGGVGSFAFLELLLAGVVGGVACGELSLAFGVGDQAGGVGVHAGEVRALGLLQLVKTVVERLDRFQTLFGVLFLVLFDIHDVADAGHSGEQAEDTRSDQADADDGE